MAGMFVPATRVPGQRREAPEWEKAGEQNSGTEVTGDPFHVKGAVPVQQRREGSDGRVATAGSGAGRQATERLRVLHNQWKESHTASACGGSSAAGASVLVAGKAERKAGYPVANTCKHPPNQVTDAAPPHGPSDRRGGVFDGHAAHLMEGPVREHRWPAAYRWKVK
ncbi:hypothetical protein B0H11DRAFT_1922191 [Mycena galericulata]|nr:hypothetical protein B0H11DRAFT_1922191 [Mycena galericulata]